jgi:hypothetical protein
MVIKLKLKEVKPTDLEVIQFNRQNIQALINYCEIIKKSVKSFEMCGFMVSNIIILKLTFFNGIILTLKETDYLCFDGSDIFVRSGYQLHQNYQGL